MTEEHAKRAYDFAIENGNTKVAENILIRHPGFKEPEVKEETKSKGKK